MVALDPLAVPAAIQAIRQHVCEHFYMRERRDPELIVRTNRREYVIPRQIAMYIARQLTGATLQEIGREFGHRHHSTVLHAINRIDAMCRTDQALNCTITKLVKCGCRAAPGKTKRGHAGNVSSLCLCVPHA
jgi:chromosomal replication initiation ATPase DnaA